MVATSKLTAIPKSGRAKGIGSAWWWIWGSAAFAFAAFGAFVIWLVPGWLANWTINWSGVKLSSVTPAVFFNAVAAARQALLFALGGVLAVITLLFTKWRDGLSQQRLVIEQDSNWTDRYTTAIAQLGNESIAIRLGGIYALERIAEDSTRDRQTVLDVLAAYLRENSKDSPEDEVKPMTADAAAAITVLGRISQLSPPKHAVDLSETNLNGANLTGANLNGANLAYVTLTGANLTSADLTGANFFEAHLTHTNLTGANLTGAILFQAYIENSDLSGANLSHTQMGVVSLQSSSLLKANIAEANLVGADLTSTDLTEVLGWSDVQLAEVRSWSAGTKWPRGFTPASPDRVFAGDPPRHIFSRRQP